MPNVSDESIQKLKRDVFPENWKNPQPAPYYDLVIVGGGPGGMTALTIARSMNLKTAIIEKEHFGGECLSVGCIPSKALLRSSRLAKEVRDAHQLGLEIPKGWKVDFKEIMERVHRLQAVISPHDSAEHFKQLGADVFLGEGRFTAKDRIEVAGQTLSFRKAIIATGTLPAPLKIPGIQSRDYLTNQNIFSLKALPQRLGVIGGGSIGCELSQAFARFGSKVVLITKGPNLLTKDTPIAAKILAKEMAIDGIRFYFNSKVAHVEQSGEEKVLFLEKSSERITVDAILVAIGRVPSVEGLGLDLANVKYDPQKGIETNEHLETTNPDIYAVGDVASRYKFTHMSQAFAKLAITNAFIGKKGKSSLIVPWCTYTDPEIARTGLTEYEADAMGIATETVTVELETVDRALLDGETAGFIRLVVKADSDQILGATLMARHAGEMISEISVAMAANKGLLAIADTIHPFPTQSQIIRLAAESLIKKRKALQHA